MHKKFLDFIDTIYYILGNKRRSPANGSNTSSVGGVTSLILLTLLIAIATGNNAHASYYTAGMATNGSVAVDVVSTANGTGIASDDLTITSTCPYGYTVSISGPSDRNLYKDGDSSNNTAGTYIAPSSGTTSSPASITGDNLGTWGYSLTSSSTSGTFIGLASTQTTLTSKDSASASGGDTIPVYYGVSIPSSLVTGEYKMTGTSAITYYLTTSENCISYQVSFNSNGGSGTTMSNQRIYEGIATELSANTYTAPSGKVFAGWNTAADGSGTSYSNQQSVTDITTPGSTITLYAQWIVPVYMQDMTFSECTTTPMTVYDKRDMQAYTIAKLADGKCWMVSNLNLAGGTVLSSDKSDVPSANYYTLPDSTTISSGTSVPSDQFSSDTTAYVFNTGNNTTTCNSSTPCNSYYSWLAATAGGKDGSGNAVSTSGYNAAYSICPKGWRLPTSTTTSNASATTSPNWKTGDWYALATAYGANLESNYYENAATFYNNAGPGTTPNFLLAGYYLSGSFNSGGSRGLYWSSTARSSTNAYLMYFNSGYVDSANNYFRRYGSSVRCVKEDPNLYNKIANKSQGTQTASDLQATITSSNSGVFQYDSSAFGADTDGTKSDGTKANIYYYRGILDSTTGTYGSDGDGAAHPNYVILQSGSSKATTDTCWRIIRTTGSGGVKLIYNGLWTGSTCANATTSAMISSPVSASTFNGTASTASIARQVVRVGYTHNSTYANTSTTGSTAYTTVMGSDSNYSVNNTDSTIKGNLETWFNNNLSGYSSILESNAGYCNDRQSYTTATGTTATSNIRPYTTSTNTGATYVAYFAGSQRNMQTTKTPSLGCPRSTVDVYSTDTSAGGNGQLSAPVALITADEASFAGSGSSTASQGSSYNANSYLRNGSTFWTMTPYYRYSSYAYNFYMNANGYMQNGRIDTAYGIRPVISLKEGTEVSGGSGIATDPWVIEQPPTMQSVTSSDLAALMPNEGDTTTLPDARDGQEYTVAKLADGKYWMTTNLNLAGGTTLNASDSNVPSDNYYTLPASSTSGFSDDTTAYVYNSGNTTSSCSSPGCYSYYSWLAATAGGNDSSGNAVSRNGYNAAYSICPKGWKLPTSTTTSNASATTSPNWKTGDWYALATAYGANLESNYYENAATFYNNAGPGTTPNFLLAGYYLSGSFNSGGSRGLYWSSTAYSSTYAYYLNFDSGYVYSADYGSRRSGYSVRCVYGE